MDDGEAEQERIAEQKRRETTVSLIAGGVVLAVVGLLTLAVPFVNVGGAGATVSVSQANGLCSTSSGVGPWCGAVSLGFYAGWVAVAIGVGLFLAPIVGPRRRRDQFTDASGRGKDS